eukprot:NODE_670_length_5356_cov_0.415066.p1 type:complete len:183 gc:universal NODE_670_length_5356_cov_0.415066:4087-4635(+)
MFYLISAVIFAQNCGAGIGFCPTIQCCSQYGFCGTTAAHCGTGCQSAFGMCGYPIPTYSVCPTRYTTDGTCGPDVACNPGYCCSTYGFCGKSNNHCVRNCYNQCTGQPPITLCTATSTQLFTSTYAATTTLALGTTTTTLAASTTTVPVSETTAAASQVQTAEASELETGFENDELIDLNLE